jgi:signal transduction histidine kinase
VVAILIIGSFIFISEQFIRIANNAEERLINVRIGSLQDAFVSFAGEKIDQPEYLNEKIAEIISTNETIKSFKIVVKEEFIAPDKSVIPNAYVVLASNDIKEINQIDPEASFLYTLASSDTTHSITIADNSTKERLFKTARAITDGSQNMLGAVITTQTLSLADIAIQKNIRDSRILLFVIILVIMLLFLRLTRIIDYMDLYKKLKEVDQLKDDFVSMASHELRTPLSIIRGYAEFIREAPELSAQTKDFTMKIDVSVKDLDSLVADILDVSRIEQGRMSFKLEKINPSALVEEVVNSLSLPAKEKGLSLSFDKSEIKEDQKIVVDSERLKQVLVNLIGNAVKYTKKGEVKVKQYREKGFLYIRISDTGIGMSEEEKEKLFEKFYRIRTEDTADIRGTGLGLWITNKIVKEMKGKISVESIKGVGSHFIVSFISPD